MRRNEDRTHLTGYSWRCECGWGTERTQSIDALEYARRAHIRFHNARGQLPGIGVA